MKEIFVRLDRCLACNGCEIACAIEHSAAKNLFAAIAETPLPPKRLYVEYAAGQRLPILCRHCDPAPCVDACMTGSMYRDETREVVAHEDARCVGCWMCIMLCPYGVVGRRREERIALKCDRCPDLETPACVTACPTRALVFVEAEEFSQTKRAEAAETIASDLGR